MVLALAVILTPDTNCPQAKMNGARDETSPGGFVIRAERGEGVMVLALHGELDLASAPVLEQQLRAAEGTDVRRVVIDLRELEFIDSTGLHVLLNARGRWRASGHVLSLVRGPTAVHRVFELTRTDSIFDFET